MENNLKAALKKKILSILSDDFDIAVVGVLRNLTAFRTDQGARIIASFRGFDGDFSKIDSDQMTRFADALRLEKTAGNSAAKAAIIVVSSFIKSAARVSDHSDQVLFQVEPSIDAHMNWAEAVEVASNYVRHLDEWQIPSKDPLMKGEALIWKSVKNLAGKLPTPRARRNADFLKRLGFKSDEIIGIGTDVSYLLAVKLGLDDFELASERFRRWSKNLI